MTSITIRQREATWWGAAGLLTAPASASTRLYSCRVTAARITMPPNTQAILLATVSAEVFAIPAAPTRNVVTIAANSLNDIAGTVSSLIEPTVHAETQTKPSVSDHRNEIIHSQKAENRNQRSDI